MVELPSEIWTKIFCHLDADDLKTVSYVCKQWNEYDQDQFFWKSVLKKQTKFELFENYQAIDPKQIGQSCIYKLLFFRQRDTDQKCRFFISLLKKKNALQFPVEAIYSIMKNILAYPYQQVIAMMLSTATKTSHDVDDTFHIITTLFRLFNDQLGTTTIIKEIASIHVTAISSAPSLFGRNSIVNRTTNIFLKQVLHQYHRYLLSPVVEYLLKKDKSFVFVTSETNYNPNALEDLKQLVHDLLQRFLNSGDLIPLIVRDLCHFFSKLLRDNFGESEQATISGLMRDWLLSRLIVLPLIFPDDYFLIDAPLMSCVQNNCLAVARMVRNISLEDNSQTNIPSLTVEKEFQKQYRSDLQAFLNGLMQEPSDYEKVPGYEDTTFWLKPTPTVCHLLLEDLVGCLPKFEKELNCNINMKDVELASQYVKQSIDSKKDAGLLNVQLVEGSGFDVGQEVFCTVRLGNIKWTSSVIPVSQPNYGMIWRESKVFAISTDDVKNGNVIIKCWQKTGTFSKKKLGEALWSVKELKWRSLSAPSFSSKYFNAWFAISLDGSQTINLQQLHTCFAFTLT